MENNTLEDYKLAIKAKYEIEKKEVHSSVFINPSRAKLRSLCLEIFKSNPDQNDLNVFSSFFRFDFSPSCSGKIKGQTDKFRPIETFFKGETNLVDVEAINLAAILVDFKPRPFLKFSKSNWNNDSVKVEIEEFAVLNKKNEQFHILTPTKPSPKNVFLEKTSKKTVWIMLVALSFAFTCYFAFHKKQCMQWSGDHYETVDCELYTEDPVKFKSIKPLDKNLIDLKKIQVCDTTTFFKNGEAIIWYAKTENGIDFFNTHGRHPKNDNALKPVTHYIINKYVK
jgi:hypothetical protein